MKKLFIATMISVLCGGMASAQMPTMNATDHVYGYHLRDVYKDIGAMKYDDTKLKEDMNGLSNKLDSINSRGDVLANSVTNINNSIASTSDRIDGMENTFNNSITNITNDVGVIKNDMADSKRNINSLVATTDKLNNHVNNLHSDVSALRGDLSKLKTDTHKGLAQANALSGLKYLGGKGLQLSVALGGYRGQSAIAYGMFYGVNDDIMLYAGGTDDSYNASINIKIGGK